VRCSRGKRPNSACQRRRSACPDSERTRDLRLHGGRIDKPLQHVRPSALRPRRCRAASPSVLSDCSVSPSFLRTTPARKPRTKCACQPVAAMIAVMVVPFGRLRRAACPSPRLPCRADGGTQFASGGPRAWPARSRSCCAASIGAGFVRPSCAAAASAGGTRVAPLVHGQAPSAASGAHPAAIVQPAKSRAARIVSCHWHGQAPSAASGAFVRPSCAAAASAGGTRVAPLVHGQAPSAASGRRNTIC
jgi:hypothetical protein